MYDFEEYHVLLFLFSFRKEKQKKKRERKREGDEKEKVMKSIKKTNKEIEMDCTILLLLLYI
jgi:hypothetical protein